MSVTVALEDDNHGSKPTTSDDIRGALGENGDLRNTANGLRSAATVARNTANAGRRDAQAAWEAARMAREMLIGARERAVELRAEAQMARTTAQTVQERALQTFDEAQQRASEALIDRDQRRMERDDLPPGSGVTLTPVQQQALDAANMALAAAEAELDAANTAHSNARETLIDRQPGLADALVALNGDAMVAAAARTSFVTAAATLGVPADSDAGTLATGAYLTLDNARANLRMVLNNPASSASDVATARIGAATAQE